MPKISILTRDSARCFFVQICILICIQIQCIIILVDIEFDIDNPRNHFGSTDVATRLLAAGCCLLWATASCESPVPSPQWTSGLCGV